MAGQNTNSFALQRVPEVAVKVVVARKEHPGRGGEGNRGDPAEHVVVY